MSVGPPCGAGDLFLPSLDGLGVVIDAVGDNGSHTAFRVTLWLMSARRGRFRGSQYLPHPLRDDVSKIDDIQDRSSSQRCVIILETLSLHGLAVLICR